MSKLKKSISGKVRNASKYASLLGLISFYMYSAMAYASSGGLTQVDDFMEKIRQILWDASIPIVTVAIMWAGYKFLFKHADFVECAKIVAGGLLIGSASAIASYLLQGSAG